MSVENPIQDALLPVVADDGGEDSNFVGPDHDYVRLGGRNQQNVVEARGDANVVVPTSSITSAYQIYSEKLPTVHDHVTEGDNNIIREVQRKKDYHITDIISIRDSLLVKYFVDGVKPFSTERAVINIYSRQTIETLSTGGFEVAENLRTIEVNSSETFLIGSINLDLALLFDVLLLPLIPLLASYKATPGYEYTINTLFYCQITTAIFLYINEFMRAQTVKAYYALRERIIDRINDLASGQDDVPHREDVSKSIRTELNTIIVKYYNVVKKMEVTTDQESRWLIDQINSSANMKVFIVQNTDVVINPSNGKRRDVCTPFGNQFGVLLCAFVAINWTYFEMSLQLGISTFFLAFSMFHLLLFDDTRKGILGIGILGDDNMSAVFGCLVPWMKKTFGNGCFKP